MAVQLTPLHDRVIVKRIEEKESVKGGIIIPAIASSSANTAVRKSNSKTRSISSFAKKRFWRS